MIGTALYKAWLAEVRERRRASALRRLDRIKSMSPAAREAIANIRADEFMEWLEAPQPTPKPEVLETAPRKRFRWPWEARS